MRVMKFSMILALVGLAAGLLPSVGLAAPVSQGANLVTNPGFEEPYDPIGRGERANGWRHWFEDTGHEGTDFVVAIERNPAVNHGGNASQHIGNKNFAWHAGMWQSVAAPAGTPLRFCAWGRVFVSNDDFEVVGGFSWDGFAAGAKVGIAPNGEEEWSSPAIVWSPGANPHSWQQICVDATAGATGKVTVFTSYDLRGAAQANGLLAQHVDGWWDDASLAATGSATAPTPTNAPGVPNPPAQPIATTAPIACQTQPDGTVTYVVQSGDTLFQIALSCDSTVDEIRRLNNLTSDLISIGQMLIVKGTAAAPAPTQAVAPTLAAATQAAPTQVGSPTPTPSPTATDAQICVEAFNDANANQVKDTSEQLLGGVGFTLSDASGPKGSYVTSGLEPDPYCFAGLVPGPYNVAARAPNGVNSTTESQWQVGLTGGMQQKIQYGGSRGVVPAGAAEPTASTGSEPAGDSSPSASDGSSSLGRIAIGGLGVLILLVAGFMAGLVLMRSRR